MQMCVLLCSTDERKLLELHKGEEMTFLGELSKVKLQLLTRVFSHYRCRIKAVGSILGERTNSKT